MAKTQHYLYNRRGERAPANINYHVTRSGRVPATIIKESREDALAHAEKSCWPHPKGHVSFYADASKRDVKRSKATTSSGISKKTPRQFGTAVCVTWRPIPNDCDQWDRCVVKTFWLDDSNAAEVYAAFVAVHIAIDESAWDPEVHTVVIYTDSVALLMALEEFDRTDDGEWAVLYKESRIDVRELWKLADALDTLVHKCGKKVEMRWVPSHVAGESFGNWLADRYARKAAGEEARKMGSPSLGSQDYAAEEVTWYMHCH
ncbi:hypothetical protein SLS58_005114 [Diplodia intermedia]|uniref:RNase H type-1 domain-containing protein n=1 Tax=Diplodia intermedia TaxID=856260 RepID=A0ABR3TSI6_9PEZI